MTRTGKLYIINVNYVIYKNQVKEKRAFKDAYRIMKKIGAFLLSLVMLLSVIVLPTNTTQAAEAMPTVSYSVHAQSYGWMNPAQNGKTAGYGLATGNLIYFLGAFYLYFINSVFISLKDCERSGVMSFGQRMNMCNITFIVSSFGIF